MAKVKGAGKTENSSSAEGTEGKKKRKSGLPHGIEELAAEVMKQKVEEENLFLHFREKRKRMLSDLHIDEVIKHRSELVTELMSNPGPQRRRELIEKIRDLDMEYAKLLDKGQ